MNQHLRRSPRISASIATLSTGFLSVVALGQDALQETIVTATRTPVPLADIGTPVIVITRNDIERSLASDVSELLHGQAGLEIARTGAVGQTTTLFTRGTDSNHTVVLVDGVRINPGTIGGAALQNLAPEAIERIEIVKGPRSALYGTDAIGGVIQLFTRGASQEGFSAGLMQGSNDTSQVFSDGAFALGERLHLGVGGSYGESGGLPIFEQGGNDRGNRTVTGRVAAELSASDRVTLRARAWRAAGRTEYAERDFFSGDILDRSSDFETSVYSAELEYRPQSAPQAPGSQGLGLRVTASRARDFIDQLQANFAGYDFAHTQRNSVDAQADLPTVAGHSLSLGVQFSDEQTAANSFGTVFDETTTVSQFFVQDQFNLGRLRTRVALGGVDHETFGSEVTWNAEIGTSFTTGTRITFSGGRAFRAPDATDRFGFGGNPQLRPEVSHQMELSLRQNLGHRQTLSLSAFDNRIQDLINYVVLDPVTFAGENRNVDRARIQGLELGWALRGEVWRAHAELTLQDPRDESQDTRLLRRSRETVSVGVSRDAGRFDTGLDIVASGNRKDFGFPTVTLDSYALVNATLRYRATSQVTLQARLENLLDEDYQFAAGYRTEGRTWALGVRYGFD